MRRTTAVIVVALCVPLALTGCSALGLDSTMVPDTSTSASPGPVSGAGWIVSTQGSATPSPVPSRGGGSRSPALPPVSFLPMDPSCTKQWTVDPVLIPMTVTPAKGSFTVSWPRQYASNYRIAAIPQPLRSGSQPAYTWQDVPAPSGCTVTATITGLKSGTPYVVWLDAPTTGYEQDGTRHPYSGKSGVVYPL
ncbi:hypothetical protein AB0M20_19590 [Actinoplanes sp. NPDC051633]|uniref:hypothetical protein n=1 Tax=Actinoplanes sp. NPDC051633 TaxID=3155670 RepID=UPI003420E896